MSGHSDKKNRQASKKSNTFLLIAIAIATGIYIFINAYRIFFKGHEVTTRQIIGFIILNGINYLLYTLINSFRGSYWESYMFDILGLNLAVEVLINFHWKFWYLYYIYPAFFLYWIGTKIYDYVKTIGKEDPNEPQSTPQDQKQKTKTKFVKVR